MRTLSGGLHQGRQFQKLLSEREYAGVREKINTISENAGKYTQESYAVVVCAIQSEWIFLQHVTWDTGDAFAGVEKMIQETCLPCLFFGNTKTLSPTVGDLSTMLIKKSGLGILNPVTS